MLFTPKIVRISIPLAFKVLLNAFDIIYPSFRVSVSDTFFILDLGIDFSKKVNKKSIELCYNDIGSKPKVDTRTGMKYSVLLENTRKLEE